MNLIDLKNNIIDLNLEMERYLVTNELVAYNKPTAFIFNETTVEWNRSESGLGETLVHPLFHEQICPHIVHSMLALNEVFKNKLYDSELINIYQPFRQNLYLISRKLKELDDEEEAKGTYFLTYEQIINDIKFAYFHLYCLYFDIGNLCFSEKTKEEYNISYERFEFFRERSIGIEWMLLEADELVNEQISYILIELITTDEHFDHYIKMLNYLVTKTG